MSAVAVLAMWLVFLGLLLVWEWWPERDGDHLDGWYHGVSAPHWTPKAWKDACDLSLQRSRERRTGV